MWFQPLIGTIKTIYKNLDKEIIQLFQPLIGTIKTCNSIYSSKLFSIVSTPHRDDKNNHARDQRKEKGEFQPLIGTIKTIMIGDIIWAYIEFQPLIGTIKTNIEVFKSRSFDICFNPS